MTLQEKFIIVHIFIRLYIGETVGKAKNGLKDPVNMAKYWQMTKLIIDIINIILKLRD